MIQDSNNSTLVKLDILKQAKGNIYDAHKKFMRSFRQEWNEDQNILNLVFISHIFYNSIIHELQSTIFYS
jgi:hypothetical protein